MNFPQAIASAFRNTLNFKTRATRSEFWWFWLFWILVLLVAQGIDGFPADQSPVQAALAFILLLPSTSLGVRRLHDINHRGWWMLVPIFVFSFVGPQYIRFTFALIYFYYLGFTMGTEGANRFGENPLRHRASGDASGDASALELLSRDDPPQDDTSNDTPPA